MTNAIELNHISKSFGEFSLKNVTLAIPAGTICGLVGENGAGKSTLIRILMGALRPDSGTAAALGVDVSAPDFLDAKEDIGVVLDEGCFPETLTAPQVGRVMAATYAAGSRIPSTPIAAVSLCRRKPPSRTIPGA